MTKTRSHKARNKLLYVIAWVSIRSGYGRRRKEPELFQLTRSSGSPSTSVAGLTCITGTPLLLHTHLKTTKVYTFLVAVLTLNSITCLQYAHLVPTHTHTHRPTIQLDDNNTCFIHLTVNTPVINTLAYMPDIQCTKKYKPVIPTQFYTHLDKNTWTHTFTSVNNTLLCIYRQR